MKIVPRAKWGAAPPVKDPVRRTWPAGVSLWVHHTDGPANQSLLEIQRYHQRVKGWNDIGYNYLIREDGTVYEGRGYQVQGAHCPSGNHEPGVALIGTYSTKAPTAAQHRAVYELKAFLRAGRLRGHRDGFPTSCPGDAAYQVIVLGPPPKPLAKPAPKLTVAQRLKKAGFGGKSVKQVLKAMGRPA